MRTAMKRSSTRPGPCIAQATTQAPNIMAMFQPASAKSWPPAVWIALTAWPKNHGIVRRTACAANSSDMNSATSGLLPAAYRQNVL